MSDYTNLDKLLEQRNIPALYKATEKASAEAVKEWAERRKEILKLLSEEEYGYLPPAVPYDVRVAEKTPTCAGKAVFYHMEMTLHCPKGDHLLPFDLVIPTAVRKAPMFVCISFRQGTPDKYVPMEEITDAGFGIANIYYKDISDDSEKKDGVYPLFDRDENTGYGKISLWAWGISRVIDHLVTRQDVNTDRIAVCGHSRLGKTALWCGANDTRVSVAFSNDSGCAGAAIYRGKIGEQLSDITRAFPFWFCKNYLAYADGSKSLEFDQHFLLSLMAPRCVYVASAELDRWADPNSEFLSCVAASETYKIYGLSGLKTPDRLPEVGDVLHNGNIGYHLRYGTHYFSREDWQRYFEFRNRHGV